MSFACPLAAGQQRRIALPFAICTIVWGSTWFVITSQLHYLPALWSIAYRFGLGAIGMFVVAGAMRMPFALPIRAHPLALIVGVTQFVLNYIFVYSAEAQIASGLVALISALLIVPNAVMGWLFLGQSVSRRFLAGSGIAMAGIALLCLDEVGRSQASAHHMLLGAVLSLAGLLCASSANVLQATSTARALPAPTLLAWSMGYGATIDVVAAMMFAGPPALPSSSLYWAGLIYLAFAGSALTFSVYFGLIRRIGPARAGYVGVLIPIIAMALSTLFEGYRWTPLALGGALLALAGLLVAVRARSPA